MNTGLFNPFHYFTRRSRFWQKRYRVDHRSELLDFALAYFIKAVIIWFAIIELLRR